MSEPFVLESSAMGWSRADQARRLGWRGLLASGALAAVSFGLAVPTDHDVFAWTLLFSLLGAAASGVALGLSSSLGGRRRPGRITIAEGRVGVWQDSGSRNVALAEVEAGWIEDPSTVHVRLTDGSTLVAVAPDLPTAEATLRALGVSVQQRLLAVPLTSAASRTLLGVPAGALGTAAVGLLVVFLTGTIGAGLRDLWAGGGAVAVGGTIFLSIVLTVAVSLLLAIVSTLRGKRLAIGVDGVALHGLLGRRFIPYDDVTDVTPDPVGVRLATKKGDVLLPTWRRGESPLAIADGGQHDGARRQRVILDRIRRATALRTPGGQELAALDRAGRSLDAWRDAVRALAQAPPDYRRIQLAASDLEDLAVDGAAPPERRIAAVMALSADDRPAARERVRIAIDTCADDELKEALEQAAEGELDEVTLRKALRPG